MFHILVDCACVCVWWFNHLSSISSEAINKQPHASING
uniref:Uncharacterized protein n=1 Tax=Anguilla anguilla TaxID=7936 RepID=A0A0E9UPS3_ANGAN